MTAASTDSSGTVERANSAGRLPSLTGLRFVAALGVFGFHIYAQNMLTDGPAHWAVGALFSPGASGVGFFFLLSGFVLTWSARSGESARGVWRKRFAKIYPNHLVTWLVAVVALVAVGDHTTALASIPGFALLQAWIPLHDVYFGGNTPAWSLSCEAAFYLAFPFLLRLINRVRASRLWPVACGLIAVVLLIPLIALPMAPDLAYWFIWVFPATRIVEFALGMVLARIVREQRWIGLGLWPATALSVAAYLISVHLPAGFGDVAATVIPLSLLIPAAATADLQGRPSPWRGRVWQWLGEVSFAFYLVHQLVIRYLDRLLNPALPALLLVAVMFAVAVLAAAALHHFVERPAMRLLSPRKVDLKR